MNIKVFRSEVITSFIIYFTRLSKNQKQIHMEGNSEDSKMLIAESRWLIYSKLCNCEKFKISHKKLGKKKNGISPLTSQAPHERNGPEVLCTNPLYPVLFGGWVEACPLSHSLALQEVG